MKQHEAVIQAMEQNGGYATLGHLYKMIDFSKWGTKTPQASVRRIVQENSAFFKIRAGLWALKEYKDKIPQEILPLENAPKHEKEASEHYYYQGMLVELGNLQNYQTFIPDQDKNQLFSGKKLKEIAQLEKCLAFTTYEKVMSRVETIDVIWFNERGFPHRVYEIEHTSDFQNSLGKFVELQDFRVEFRIVAMEARKDEFKTKLERTIFQPIKGRVEFINYDTVLKRYEHASALKFLKD